MTFDYSKLEGRIKQICDTQYRFSDEMGWSTVTTSKKLKSKVFWRQDEIIEACEILKIPHSQISSYFFTKKV